MAEAGGGRPRVPSLVKAGAGLAVGWWVAFSVAGAGPDSLREQLINWARSALAAFPAARRLVEVLFYGLMDLLHSPLAASLAVATVSLCAAVLARVIARARVRAGYVDPLDRVRRWVETHAIGARAVFGLAALPWVALSLNALLRRLSYVLAQQAWMPLSLFACIAGLLLLPIGLGAVAWVRAGQAARRELLAPTLDASEQERSRTAGNQFDFNAIAVTPETRGAVGVMAAASLAMAAIVAAVPVGVLWDGRLMGVLAGYLALALAGAAAFRQASRIAVGVDGVFVTGTSRTRFYAYKDLDGVQMTASAVVLVRGGKVVVQLQLHGEDAAKRGAIVEKIQGAIERSKQGLDAGAAHVVDSVSGDALARLAQGGGDYRAAAVTREQLWAIVEGPEHDAHTRAGAAGALATTGDAAERARLRIAAAHCAEPQVRVALQELAQEDEDDGPLLGRAAARLAR
jgi:hypothetical protein